MIDNNKICFIPPPHEAARALERTAGEITRATAGDVVLADAAGHDDTVANAAGLGLHVERHAATPGDGALTAMAWRAQRLALIGSAMFR